MTRGDGRYWPTAGAIVLLLLLTLALPASARLQLLTAPEHAVSSASETVPFICLDDPVSRAFTMRTVTTVAKSVDPADGGDPVWLAGVGTRVGEAPTALALRWAPSSQSSWWGVIWALQLQSVDGTIELAQVYPLPGHRYESLFSYDEITGAVSVRFTDLTEERDIYQGTFAVEKVPTPLYAAAGTGVPSTGETSLFSVERVETYPRYLPVGLRWTTGVQTADDSLVSMRRFERNETVGLRLETGGSLVGAFQLLSIAGSTVGELATVRASGSTMTLSWPATDLPLGDSVLCLEYSENGIALLRDTTDLSVGTALFEFAAVSIDSDKGLLSGSVAVSSAGVLEDMGIRVRARVDEIAWNEATRAYQSWPVSAVTVFDDTIDIPYGTPMVLPLQMSVPTRPGYWQITFEPVVVSTVTTQSVGTEQCYNTYVPANLTPGEPFAIAFVPDTQYHNRTYHEIFIRQFQWLAEQAKERSIVLTTLLGDITDDNSRGQWQRARDTIGILDGVIPYVLAQGNHDILPGGGTLSERERSMINDYFPVGKQPWLTGTFEPERVENSYSLFTFQGSSYLILSLEFGPRDEVLDWANRIVSEHPDHKVIMITHSYTSKNGGRSNSPKSYEIGNDPAATVNAAPEMWSKLVQQHANFQLVVSGHAHSDGIPRQVALGVHGNPVYEMLIDYQSDPMGGNGYMVLMTFHPDETIEVKAYSPYLGQERDLVSPQGYTNHFVIDTRKGRFLAP